jgi:membrane-anchored protein YejM (alkaline phosphatase superfamily)
MKKGKKGGRVEKKKKEDCRQFWLFIFAKRLAGLPLTGIIRRRSFYGVSISLGFFVVFLLLFASAVFADFDE